MLKKNATVRFGVIFAACCIVSPLIYAGVFNVSLRAPSTGSCYNLSEYVDVEAFASHSLNTITRVDLYVDGAFYSSDMSSPYLWRLTGLAAGSHTLYVEAADSASKTAASEVYTIYVGNPPMMASRTFSSPPAVGVHPRLFFNASELSEVYNFWHNTAFGVWMRNKVNGEINHSSITTLAALDLSGGVTQVMVDTYVIDDEMRNIRFWLTALDAYVHNNTTYKTNIRNAIYNYAQIVIASKTMRPTDTNHDIWKNNGWAVGNNWVCGDGFAFAYDLAYNDMTTQQRDTVRLAIAMVTEGRRAWGMGYPATRIVSNWSMYNSSLFTTVAAIEGETGFDQQVYDLYLQLAEDYFTHAFYECGGIGEDGYVQLALREGGPAMIAMARRGHNFFENPHVQAATRYLTQTNDPSPYAELVGHSAGGSYTYPGIYMTLKYAFPNDPVFDWTYRRCLTHEQNTSPGTYYTRSQTYHIQATFGSDVAGIPASPFTQLSSNLGLSAFYPRRGLMVTRSDWTSNALYLHYDARPDAYYMGHDNVDRGTFTLSALGRSWVPDRNGWNEYVYAEDHALMYIDGVSEPFKAPSVKFLHYQTDNNITVAAADLKYAYDWWWSPAWPTSSTTYPSPAAHEDNGPRAVGWPGNEDWLPTTLYGLPDFSFAGSYMWRKPHNTLEKYFRTMVLVRGTTPYVLAIEDIKKDSSSHLYEWYMPLESDISLVSFSGSDVVVGDTAGKRLLLRAIEAGGAITARVEDYVNTITDTAHPTGHPARRLVIGCTTVTPNLKIMIWPHLSTDALPTTSLTNGLFVFSKGSQTDQISFVQGTDGRTYVNKGPLCPDMPGDGDMNGDHQVDMADFAQLAQSWQECYFLNDLMTLVGKWMVVSLEPGQYPYPNSVAHLIPGQIEAEDYDTGGEGVAYHDTNTGNAGGQYRMDNVDIGVCLEGGYNVGWTYSGEWLEYTVKVESSGNYNIEARTASTIYNGQFHIEIDGTNVTGTVTCLPTGSWDVYSTTTVSNIPLTAGPHIVRVVMESNSWNFNWIRFTRSL
jgi:hypothetical protein